MLNGIIDSRGVRAQKAAQTSQSLGSSFVPRRLEERLEIEMLKESLRQWDKEMRRQNEEMRQRDKAMRQRDKYYSQVLARLQATLQVS
jgi:hypothetical protein